MFLETRIVCTRVQEQREWISEFSLVLQESQILESMSYDIDVPGIVMSQAQCSGDCRGSAAMVHLFAICCMRLLVEDVLPHGFDARVVDS